MKIHDFIFSSFMIMYFFIWLISYMWYPFIWIFIFHTERIHIQKKKVSNKTFYQLHVSPNTWIILNDLSVLSILFCLIHSWGLVGPTSVVKLGTYKHDISARVFLCFVVSVLIEPFALSAELAMWGECDYWRPSLYNLSCNSPIPASKRQVWTQWEETWCFVHRQIYLKFISWKFTRTILTWDMLLTLSIYCPIWKYDAYCSCFHHL